MGHWSTYRRRGGRGLQPAAAAHVISVTKTGPTLATWLFDQPFTVTSVPSPELTVQTGTGQTAPADFNNIGSDFLELEYAALIVDGGAWQALTEPSEMTFTGGLDLAVPSTGTLL